MLRYNTRCKITAFVLHTRVCMHTYKHDIRVLHQLYNTMPCMSYMLQV